MVTVVITLLTLCVGLVFVFMVCIESLDKDVKNIEKRYKNEIEVVNYKFNNVNNDILKQDIEFFKLKEQNTQLEKQIKGLELQILKLKDIDSARYY
jgi:predicted  nucleic acid-binding Zn-ribbon protein